MDSVSLHCLGVGDGTASTGRNHSAYLYSFGETRVLVDCGEPVGRTLKMAGISPDAVDTLFLSHLHSDHIGGLLMLLQGWWLDNRRKALPIVMPRDGIEPIRTIIRTAYLFDEILPFKIIFEAIQGKQPIDLPVGLPASPAPPRATLFPTTHLDRARKNFQAIHPGDYAAYSFLFEAEGKRVVHSADIGAPQDLEALLAKPVDLLVCEVAHFEPRELFEYLRGRPIRQVVLTHVTRYDWEEKMGELRRSAEKELAGMKVIFAADNQVVQLA